MGNNKLSLSPAQLRTMSEDNISSLFHSSNWDKIDAETKLNLCQEVENRMAARDGIEPRTVVSEKMNGSLYGELRNDIIAINADMLQDGVFCTTYVNENGNQVTSVHAVDAPSWNTYDTIAHEHTHGFSLDKGEMPYTYITPETDYDLYRIQDEERMAFARGNDATKEAIIRAEKAVNRSDIQKEDYLDSIKNDSFEKSLENAQMKYNDPFIDKTLATFINDRDNGITRENASPAYKRIEALYNEQLQRQLSEIIQSKEQLSEKDIKNIITEAQNKTEDQLIEMSEKNDTLTKEAENKSESQELVEKDGELLENTDSENANDENISIFDGAEAETLNDMQEVSDITNDGYEEDFSISAIDNETSYNDDEAVPDIDDGGTFSVENGITSDDGSMDSSDDGMISDGGGMDSSGVGMTSDGGGMDSSGVGMTFDGGGMDSSDDGMTSDGGVDMDY